MEEEESGTVNESEIDIQLNRCKTFQQLKEENENEIHQLS